MTLVIFDTLRRCEDNATFVSDSDPSSLRREISFHLDVNAVRNVIPFHGLPAEKINGREERKWGGRGTRATRDYSVRQRRGGGVVCVCDCHTLIRNATAEEPITALQRIEEGSILGLARF